MIGKNIFNTLIEKAPSLQSIIIRVHSYLKDKKFSYYLFIDEYDHFANRMFTEHKDSHYQNLTHKDGFIRSFFAGLKAQKQDGVLARIFITGVSPLLLGDVSSGFNIQKPLHDKLSYTSMAGFTETEVKEIIQYYHSFGIFKESVEEIINLLKFYGGGYSFHEDQEEDIFNSDMVLYFIDNYIESQKIPVGENLLDHNIRTGNDKLIFLLKEGNNYNGNFNVFKQFLLEEEYTGPLIRSFTIEEITQRKFTSKEKFVSLFYYFGLLTLNGLDIKQNYVFKIPNQTIRILQWQFFIHVLQEKNPEEQVDLESLKNILCDMALFGDFNDPLRFLAGFYFNITSIRDTITREEGVKVLFLTFLNFFNIWKVHSEKEARRGFSDIYLEKNFTTKMDVKYEYLIEFKYFKAEEKPTEEALQKAKEEAKEQLERYALDKNINYADKRSGLVLKKLIFIINHSEVLLLEEI
jgi:hypothetical protein